MHAESRIRHASLEDRSDDAEIFEHLQRARLNPLSTRAAEWTFSCVNQTKFARAQTRDGGLSPAQRGLWQRMPARHAGPFSNGFACTSGFCERNESRGPETSAGPMMLTCGSGRLVGYSEVGRPLTVRRFSTDGLARENEAAGAADAAAWVLSAVLI